MRIGRDARGIGFVLSHLRAHRQRAIVGMRAGHQRGGGGRGIGNLLVGREGAHQRQTAGTPRTRAGSSSPDCPRRWPSRMRARGNRGDAHAIAHEQDHVLRLALLLAAALLRQRAATCAAAASKSPTCRRPVDCARQRQRHHDGDKRRLTRSTCAAPSAMETARHHARISCAADATPALRELRGAGVLRPAMMRAISGRQEPQLVPAFSCSAHRFHAGAAAAAPPRGWCWRRHRSRRTRSAPGSGASCRAPGSRLRRSAGSSCGLANSAASQERAGQGAARRHHQAGARAASSSSSAAR